jgi:hypothetical protein
MAWLQELQFCQELIFQIQQRQSDSDELSLLIQSLEQQKLGLNIGHGSESMHVMSHATNPIKLRNNVEGFPCQNGYKSSYRSRLEYATQNLQDLVTEIRISNLNQTIVV